MRRRLSPAAPVLHAALLERAGETHPRDKITGHGLGDAARYPALTPAAIRNCREAANMSQRVFADLINVTPGFLSDLERGVKQASGSLLVLLHLIRRGGVEVLL
jgi:putative transcriptional regulator